MKIEVLCIGSATVDIFLKPQEYFLSSQNIRFPFPAKIEAKNLFVGTGGAGTNVATALSHFGFKVAYVGRVGKDLLGDFVLQDLQRYGVITSFVKRDRFLPTNLSVILSPERDRLIFSYHGAGSVLRKRDVPWNLFSSLKGLYLDSLSDSSLDVFSSLLERAQKYSLPVYWNPSLNQLQRKEFQEWIRKVTWLQLNERELQMVVKKRDLLRAALSLYGLMRKDSFLFITLGEKGVLALAGKTGYIVTPPRVKVKEKTGAGDAFASGTFTGFLRGYPFLESIFLGVCNALSCLKSEGAKGGFWPAHKPPLKLKFQKICL